MTTIHAIHDSCGFVFIHINCVCCLCLIVQYYNNYSFSLYMCSFMVIILYAGLAELVQLVGPLFLLFGWIISIDCVVKNLYMYAP